MLRVLSTRRNSWRDASAMPSTKSSFVRFAHCRSGRKVINGNLRAESARPAQESVLGVSPAFLNEPRKNSTFCERANRNETSCWRVLHQIRHFFRSQARSHERLSTAEIVSRWIACSFARPDRNVLPTPRYIGGHSFLREQSCLAVFRPPEISMSSPPASMARSPLATRPSRPPGRVPPRQWPVKTRVCTGSSSAWIRRIAACTIPSVSTMCRNSHRGVPRLSDSSSSWLFV